MLHNIMSKFKSISISKPANIPNQQMQYICINCGHPIAELYRKYSNTAIKTNHCERCKRVADKYVEFDSIVILVDAMLLSQESYRHMLHNRSFKLNCKLFLVLLLLESFALWRQKAAARQGGSHNEISENGFYLCCMLNLTDYFIVTLMLFLVTIVFHPRQIENTGLSKFLLNLLKAVTIANFSKIFLLPLIAWRENTTNMGINIHQLLVLAHHLFSLMYIYELVGNFNKVKSCFIILFVYLAKEQISKSPYLQRSF
ncbi:protein ARV1 isoform X1 [Ceratitis capitata]|uniref:protein ARV1 isoform X1 n=1 Tax=Ceratitis capitata TaxID=7213 RepID=UPI00032A214D|nr:protein ARV1 isoform X1 [Ceratitis capitata]XP_020713388.1 protein ARV1 isoform X1 [Ceratitis capitata]